MEKQDPHYLSLLRGINVGGHRQIKMEDLKRLYEALGLEDVQILLQTGNVLFRTADTDPAELANRLEKACEQQFGFHTSIMVLRADELKKIAAENPFSHSASPESTAPKAAQWIVITFLFHRPDPSAIEELRQYEGPEERFVTERAVYIYYPEGAGRSKLTNALIEKRLKVRATARNWNTVTKLLARVK